MAADPTVVLLIGAETGVLDESQYARPLTPVGNAARTTAQFKYGAASLTFDGAGDRIDAPDSPDLDFGAGNFTIEGWFRFLVKTTDQALLGQWDVAGDTSKCAWFLFQNGALLAFRGMDTFSSHDVQALWTATLGQWYHIAVDRSGTTVRLYVNGAVIASDTGYTWTLNNSPNPFNIGAISTGTSYASFDFNGQMDEIRLTKGVARYNGAFTPPAGPFPRPTAAGGGAAGDPGFLLGDDFMATRYNLWRAITPSDTVDLPTLTDAILVGVAGNVAAVMENNQVAVLALPAGWVPIAARRINATGTTATGLVALNQD